MTDEEKYASEIDKILSVKNTPIKPNTEEFHKSAILPTDSKPTENIAIKASVINDFNYNMSKYEECFIVDLPMSFMYETGTRIYIRSCTVKEIQDFSTYDKNNPFDFRNKLNDIIENCVILQKPDGTLDSYLNLFDGDRMWLIYNIREKTFPQGNVLTTTVKVNDKEEVIEIRRENIDIFRDDEIMNFFDDKEKMFIFNTSLVNKEYCIYPPRIGLKNVFNQYLDIQFKNKKITNIDAPFIRIAPFLINKTIVTFNEIEKLQKWFEETLTPDEYSFLSDLINNHLKIGIKGLKKNKGKSVIRTTKIYPNELSSIFIISNAFNLFIKR